MQPLQPFKERMMSAQNTCRVLKGSLPKNISAHEKCIMLAIFYAIFYTLIYFQFFWSHETGVDSSITLKNI